MDYRKTIGIVGGVGPYAGLNLCEKIFDQTITQKDQDHLSIVIMSMPAEIEDRTLFIQKQTKTNPAYAIVEIIRTLEKAGVKFIGIPCNSAHVPVIFDVILEELGKSKSEVKIIHMVKEVAQFVRDNYPKIKSIGVLSTTGTYISNVYHDVFTEKGIQVIKPTDAIQHNMINRAIYDPDYGIKACSNPIHWKAKKWLKKGIDYLKKQKVDAIILGCTEISLAIKDDLKHKTPIIDSTLILARALIREAAPDKLKELKI